MLSVAKIHQIDEDVLNALGAAETEANALRLTGQLDRKLYIRTNEVLESLGGKWDRKAKAHIFDGDAADLVDSAILTKSFTKTKQDFGFFETPDELARDIVHRAKVMAGMLILEPSAGTGRLADQCKALGAMVTCVELQAKNREILAAKGYKMPVQPDFLKLDVVSQFDRVVMNPPFARRADILHIGHAAKFLKLGGRLVAIASASVGFRNDRIGNDFRALVNAHGGTIEDLPPGSFKDSGTGVNTVLVTMNFG